MDFKNKNIKIVFILLSFYLSMTNGINVDCNGKAFHCVDSTHFKICVDLGGGVSTTVDNFVLPCPYNTYCRPTNNYECEYYETTTTTTTIKSESDIINKLDDAFVIPLSTGRKLEAISYTNKPASLEEYTTEYIESSVRNTIVTSTSSYTDNQLINSSKTTDFTTYTFKEDVSTKELRNETTEIIFKAKEEMNETTTDKDLDFNYDALNTTVKSFDYTTLPQNESLSIPTTENYEKIFEIKNLTILEGVPTVVVSHEYIKSNKTSGNTLNVEVIHTSNSTKQNETSGIKNNTIKIKSIFPINKSEILESENIVFKKTNKEINLANIISTTLNDDDRRLLQNITQENLSEKLGHTSYSTSNMGLLNKITNNDDVGNHSLINNYHDISFKEQNMSLINDTLRVQHYSLTTVNETENLNDEIISTTPVESNSSTSNLLSSLSTTESYELTSENTELSYTTEFNNDQLHSTNVFSDWNIADPSRAEPQIENSTPNTAESLKPNMSSDSYFTLTTNVIFTTENYINNDLSQNDAEKYWVTSNIVHSNTLDNLQETTITTEQFDTTEHNVFQQVTINSTSTNETKEISQYNDKGNLALNENNTESKNRSLFVNNLNEGVEFNNRNSNLITVKLYSAMLTPTTENYEQKIVSNITTSYSLLDTTSEKVLLTSTEEYKTTTFNSESSSISTFEENNITNFSSSSLFFTTTETYKPPSLSENLLNVTYTFKNISSDNNISSHSNYKTNAYDEIQTENPLQSFMTTYESTLLITKKSESNNENNTDAQLTHKPHLIKNAERLPIIEHPSHMIVKNNTGHNEVTINPTDINTYNSNLSSFEESISGTSGIPINLNSSNIVAESSTQKNGNRMNNSVLHSTKDFNATTELLITPEPALNTRTKSPATIATETTLGILNIKTTTPYMYNSTDENSPIYDLGLESKTDEGNSDYKLLDAVSAYVITNVKNKSSILTSHDQENTTSKIMINNADNNTNLSLIHKNSTVFSNTYNELNNVSDAFLNTSAIQQQFDKNQIYAIKPPYQIKRDFKDDSLDNATGFTETTDSKNTTNKAFIMETMRDITNISESKLNNNMKPITINNTIQDNQYEFDKSKKLKTNVSNDQLASSDYQNLKTQSSIGINNVSLFIKSNSSLNNSNITTQQSGNKEKSVISLKAKDSSNNTMNDSIIRLNNSRDGSLAALILPKFVFNSTQTKNYNQSETTKTNLLRNEQKFSNVHVNYTQITVDNDCKNRPSGKYADKNDCKKFYLCLGEAQPYIGECPNGTVFSESKKQCTKNLSQCYRNNQFKCLSPGRYYDLRVKNVYYICLQNRGKFIKFKYQCHNGYSLNTTIVQCIQESSNDSTAKSSDSSNTKEESTSISLESSPKATEEGINKDRDDNKYEFECTKEGKYRHPNECNKYYVCSKTKKSEFRRKVKSCDSGEVFNKEKQKCIDSNSDECK